ncbi:MAG TPA: RNA methyltransferase [Clostridia bacterium]|nr:RNA methyltransferase [Clostridia bacterium]
MKGNTWVVIESPQNPLIKSLAKLARDVGERRLRGECILEGSHLVYEALKGRIPLRVLLFTREFYERTIRDEEDYRALLLAAVDRGTKMIEASEAAIKRVATTVEPQGIIAAGKIPALNWDAFIRAVQARGNQERREPERSRVIVVGDSIKDPGNCGAIVRNCHALGSCGVVFTGESVDPFSPKALRAAQGSTFHIPVIVEGKRSEAIRRLRTMGARIIVTDVTTGKAPTAVDFSGTVAVVIGEEAHGVSDEFRAESAMSVKIPMPGGAESLNVAVTSGIILYEVLRRRMP